MRSGIHVGRIFGINIYVDWSWILIFVLVTWNLAGALFPSIHPGWSLALNLTIGISASILFFASVLAHELAHSVVAKGRGLPVRRITLFIFGGVSNIEKEPPSPGTEFLVAVVGPLTSLVLGAVFLFLGRADSNLAQQAVTNPQRAMSNLSPLATMFLYLGSINILLGVFNLIPGFPLDGGRLLRSILWSGTNSLRQATRWATWIGQGIAWIFIIVGISMVFGLQVPILGGGIINGIWLAFIGWFLNNAASQSYRQVVIEDVLEGVCVDRLMRSDVPTVEPDFLVSQLVDDYLMGTDERSFPVVQGEQLIGIVTLEDVRKIPRSNWDATRVREIMTPEDKLDVVAPDDDVADALNKITSRDVRQIPVLDNGHLVGILRRRDIIRWLRLHSDRMSARG
jgi:Zn-dependent protease/CBS domain-containing protein